MIDSAAAHVLNAIMMENDLIYQDVNYAIN